MHWCFPLSVFRLLFFLGWVFSCRLSRGWSFQIIVIFHIFPRSRSRWEGRKHLQIDSLLCLTLPVCRDISLSDRYSSVLSWFPPVAPLIDTHTHTHTLILTRERGKKKRKKEKQSFSIDSGRSRGPICLFSVSHSFVPGSNTSSLFFFLLLLLLLQEESSSYYLQAQRERERERQTDRQTDTNKNDLEEYTTSVWFGPLHPKGREKFSWFVSRVEWEKRKKKKKKKKRLSSAADWIYLTKKKQLTYLLRKR